MNYYNEFDPKTAAWLRELIKIGIIPKGIVDERDIKEVQGDELVGYRQCHFFAGIGGWPYALKLAGVKYADDWWSGSCPCQPYSIAGEMLGDADPRNLWPAFFSLIKQRRPTRVVGEQVEGATARPWLRRVRADLEGIGYRFAASDLCSAGVGFPHQRQRFHWAASDATRERGPGLESSRGAVKVRQGWPGSQEDLQAVIESPFSPGPCWPQPLIRAGDHGLSYRVVGCSGAGNAINPVLAAEFIRTFLEAEKDLTQP